MDYDSVSDTSIRVQTEDELKINIQMRLIMFKNKEYIMPTVKKILH